MLPPLEVPANPPLCPGPILSLLKGPLRLFFGSVLHRQPLSSAGTIHIRMYTPETQSPPLTTHGLQLCPPSLQFFTGNTY